MRSRHLIFVLLLDLMMGASLARGAEPGATDRLAVDFRTVVLPLVQRYCLECHSAAEQEGDLDLERFTQFDQVRNATPVWQRVAEQVASGEMPPREAPQPTAAERAPVQRWINEFLAAEATRRAGDPGRVILRRLNNAEYTYTLRDLTGLDAIEPAREFPVDGAAGEGFTNTGHSLVMSPALVTKYLDAAKEVASHAALLPDGFQFLPGTTSRDWTEATLAAIRQFYGQFTAAGQGGSAVNLQGIVFDTNAGGRLPIEPYLAATVAERSSLTTGTKTIETVASQRGLNARYLTILWQNLTNPAPSLLIGGLQTRWQAARVEDVPALATEVVAWQKGLWQFASVGHIGKANGPKAWMTPVNPLASRQQIRFPIPPVAPGGDATISLVATDAGDGNRDDWVVWQEPRIVAPGRPDLPLRDVRRFAAVVAGVRTELFGATARHLTAATELGKLTGQPDLDSAARQRGLEPAAFRAWCDTLGVAGASPVHLTGHFTTQLAGVGGHAFINGWGSNQTPLLLVNSSDQTVRIPGQMKPHGVVVHPSPTLRAAVGWQSPGGGVVRVAATVTPVHPECGNGVTWTLDLRHGTLRTRLAAGLAVGGKPVPVGPIEGVAIQPGDVVVLAIGPRDGNHACDSTAIDLTIDQPGTPAQSWDLAADLSSDILAGNPHADRLGHAHVWHFFTESDDATSDSRPNLPGGSILARWQAAPDGAAKQKLATDLERLLAADSSPVPSDGPDGKLYQILRSLRGPLLGPILATWSADQSPPLPETGREAGWGLDPALFGKHPGSGATLDPASLCIQAPAVLAVRIPAELAEGAALVTTAQLADGSGTEGSVQVQVVAGTPEVGSGLRAGDAAVTLQGASWTSTTRSAVASMPILTRAGSAGQRRIEAALADFRALFPPALCYSKVVPVDEVVTLTLFHREDDHLARLMLDDAQKAHLDRLWDQLHFVSRDALTLVDAYAQLMEYASQDGDPRVFEPLRQPILDRAAAFRRQVSTAEPGQLDALVAFAARVYRRPLTDSETHQLRSFHARLRMSQIPHDEAFRLTLARILVAPAFLYRIETPGPGSEPGPVANHVLATRLSYFLTSSTPDRELCQAVETGQLADPANLPAQTRRLLQSPKIRRLATEFGCHWLQIADFAGLDEKSERHFPTFLALRGAMHEESVRFLTDLFQHDGSVLDLLDGDHTFLNGPLAEHYGISLEPVAGLAAADWRRVDGIKRYGRGGMLGQATTLAQHSGASRTSPTLRGNWISEVLLGERLPRPPKGVAQLPDDEAATAGLTVRQLVTQHASDAKCAGCHTRIDPLGFALESFDAIGRRRDQDLGNRPIDNRAQTRDGANFAGLAGLQDYLLTTRREAFVRQFCRKLLGYALGRATQLSDETLLGEMQARLRAHDYHVSAAIEAIVLSRQFRTIRGVDTAETD